MNNRRTIEPGSAASEPEPDDEEGTQDMPRRSKQQEGPMAPGPEREARIIELYQEGLTTKEIREAVGLTYDSAIYLALKNAGITPNRNGPYAPRGSNNGATVALEDVEDLPLEVTLETVTEEVSVPVTVELTDTPAEPEGDKLETYVLHVTMLQPVTVDVEVDVPSFDEAVNAAHALPGLVSILGVLRADAVKHNGGDA